MARDRAARTVDVALDALGRSLDEETALNDRRRAALVEINTALLELRTMVAGHGASHGAGEPVAPEFAAAQTGRLLERSDGLVRTCVLTVESGPGTDQSLFRHNQDRLREGLVQRAIYPAGLFDTAAGRRWMLAWAAAGEEQRVLGAPPSEFAVFGTYAAIVSARWGEPDSGYLLVRDPMLVSTYTALFDTAYAQAVPAPSHPTADEDRQLLSLLAAGLKDEAIARYLGLGLRTVRRRIGRLMETHGIGTRFQLGVVAASQGMLDSRRGGLGPPTRGD